MNIGPYGVEIGNMQLVCIHTDERGRWFVVKGQRQQIDIRITPSGLVRVGAPRKTHPGMSCFGEKKNG
jgi:hypothetical protein